MNWKNLDKNLNDFASQIDSELVVENTNIVENQIEYYRIIENNSIFYELKHTKPIPEYGSKFRIYSALSDSNLKIESKKPLFRKVKLTTSRTLNSELIEHLNQLCSTITEFCWITTKHNLAWPTELNNKDVLKFSCNEIDLTQQELCLIRQIHISITEELENVPIIQ